jgi:ADP-ribose pyrophosphatase YjhB (NUDIX family)
MIDLEKPLNFQERFEVVSCFVEHNRNFLLLHRQDYKPQGNTWGVPAGKVNQNETLLEAITREIKEETSLEISPLKIQYFKKFYVTYPDYQFSYHIFHASLEDNFPIQIDLREHKNFKWVSPLETLKMNLILDEDFCIKLFYRI